MEHQEIRRNPKAAPGEEYSYNGIIHLVIGKDSKPISPDLACWTATGMSCDQLVQAILENRNGEFDHLFHPGTARKGNPYQRHHETVHGKSKY